MWCVWRFNRGRRVGNHAVRLNGAGGGRGEDGAATLRPGHEEGVAGRLRRAGDGGGQRPAGAGRFVVPGSCSSDSGGDCLDVTL